MTRPLDRCPYEHTPPVFDDAWELELPHETTPPLEDDGYVPDLKDMHEAFNVLREGYDPLGRTAADRLNAEIAKTPDVVRERLAAIPTDILSYDPLSVNLPPNIFQNDFKIPGSYYEAEERATAYVERLEQGTPAERAFIAKEGEYYWRGAIARGLKSTTPTFRHSHRNL